VNALRARVPWIATMWLCCQLSLLAVAPLSLAHPDAEDSVACTCVHTGSTQCPMHHPATPAPTCQCRSTTDPAAATVVALLGPIAVLANAPSPIAPPAITKLPSYPITRLSVVVAAPDGPPPRA